MLNKEQQTEYIEAWNNNIFCLLSEAPKKSNNSIKKIVKTRKQCKQCNNTFETSTKSVKFCSRICVGVYQKTHTNYNFKKDQVAWNKGKHNPLSAENGKRGAAKSSKTCTGRRRKYNSDGSWVWHYPPL